MRLRRDVAALVREVPMLLRRRADGLRVQVFGRRELLRREGMPEDQVSQHGKSDLAWADFLDALAGRRRG